MDTMKVCRGRARLAVGALMFAASTAVALGSVAPAQAATTVTDGSVKWGFKQSFRSYVVNVGNSLPVAERITLTAPATFDPESPAVPTTSAEAVRPYIFPADSGAVNSQTDATIVGKGGVNFNHPAHFFSVSISKPKVVVSGSTATIYADTVYDATQAGNGPAGHFENTQVAIAVSNDVSVNVSSGSATVSATNVTLTQAGHDALPLYPAGEPLDNLTVSATLQDPAPPSGPNGSVTVSKNTANPAGDTITVNGSGFAPTVNGTRPPLSGKPGGVYVVFGKFLDTWQPTAGAASAARKIGVQKWAVLAADMATVGGAAAGAVELKPDGTFTATLENVNPEWSGVTADTPGNYGIYTFGGSGANHTGYETFTPITFSTADASDGQQQIVATVSDQPGGEFTWTIDATDKTVNLGTLISQGSYLQAIGAVKPVVVTDTRLNQANSWSVSGQAGTFYNGARSLSGGYLGWTPSVTQAGAGATAAAVVPPGHPTGDGLKVSRVLASGASGHAIGSATLGADLELRVPAETKSGTYSALLTLTAIS